MLMEDTNCEKQLISISKADLLNDDINVKLFQIFDNIDDTQE